MQVAVREMNVCPEFRCTPGASSMCPFVVKTQKSGTKGSELKIMAMCSSEMDSVVLPFGNHVQLADTWLKWHTQMYSRCAVPSTSTRMQTVATCRRLGIQGFPKSAFRCTSP